MKIVITGPIGSGKTSLIKRLDKTSLSVDEFNHQTQHPTTVAMDLGKINVNGVPVTLFGTPGLSRFTTIRSILFKGTDALIFLFDGKDLSITPEIETIFSEIGKELKRSLVPFSIIIAINKDKDEKVSIDLDQFKQHLKTKLSIENPHLYKAIEPEFIEINISNEENFERLIEYATESSLRKWKPIIELLKKYQEDLMSLRKELGINTEELKDLLNDLELRELIKLNRQDLSFILTDLGKKVLALK